MRKNANVREIMSSVEIRVARELARLRRVPGSEQTIQALTLVRRDVTRLYRASGIHDAYMAGIRVGRRRK